MINIHDSLGVSIGAPRRDTLYFTHRTLEGLSRQGSQVVFDSFRVSALIANRGGLVHMVTVPVQLDSLGCFHPLPAVEKSDGKMPY
jgi:hypothetical protein